MNLLSTIESVLFVASKPLSARDIAKAIQKNPTEVEEALENLKLKYNREDSGICILQIEDKYQMSTNQENFEAIEKFIKSEATGELTKAQLETLTVVAYRGPITRPELEQIRGVNCSLIIRNLLMRGLIEEKEDETKFLPVYSLSFDALSHLGVKTPIELPDFENLSKHEYIEKVIEQTNNSEKSE